MAEDNQPVETLRVLVLNSTYEPLHFCNARRAVVLTMKGKAESLELNGHYLHTFTETFRLPTVIRLYRYVKLPRYSGAVFSKKNVFRRDNHTCQYCGHTGSDLTIDHIVPRSQGGATSWENIVVACKPCNLRKGNRKPEQVGLMLVRQPVRPRFLMNQPEMDHVPRTFLEGWQKYLAPVKRLNAARRPEAIGE